MLLYRMKYLIVGLALFIGNYAHANIVQFTEFYSGIINQEITYDGFIYEGQSSFFNSNASLILDLQIVNFLPDIYAASGTFTRVDDIGAFGGNIWLTSLWPEVSDPLLPQNTFLINGVLDSDSLHYFINDGYRDTFASGILNGFIDASNTVNFSIDWTLTTYPRQPYPSVVPTPPTIYLLVAGLLVVVGASKQKQYLKTV